MRRSLPFLLFFTVSTIAYGQEGIDSLQQKLDAVHVSNIDSLQTQLIAFPDSLLPSYHKIDSIRQNFNQTADSLKTEYTNALQEVDRYEAKLNKRIDSLQRLDLSANEYTQKLDSVSRWRQTIESKFTSRLNELKKNTTGKLQELDLPAEYKEPLQSLTQKVEALNINTDVAKLPPLEIPGYSLPELDGVNDLASGVPRVDDIGGLTKVADIDVPSGKIDAITKQATAYEDDLKNIADGNLDKVDHLPETIEQQASKVEGIDELQKYDKLADEQLKTLTDPVSDPKKAKEKAVTMAKEKAVDHFAGKQEQLKAAMEKMSKYKQKYSSVSSIKDLPKRPPNPMKSKPFIERLVPGVYLQYQRKNAYLLDVNPYVGYKLSGRFTAGLGWNHRYAYDKDHRQFDTRSRIFGPRAYVDFKLGKGFTVHLEGETMNSFIPSTLRGNPDTGTREWVWSLMTGMKKEYRIYKDLKGTALIQYNLFNRHYKAPYVDRLNSRIGFEYVLKKRKKK